MSLTGFHQYFSKTVRLTVFTKNRFFTHPTFSLEYACFLNPDTNQKFRLAGYNNLEVVDYLLQNGANVNAQDKGGLIPLHNASSYGHLEIAALLIKHNTNVNATDKWGFTPLHEAAEKARTHICSLLVS